MATKPTKFPKWAAIDVTDPVSGQNNVVEPTEAFKDSGWERNQIPPRQWFNWLSRTVNQWIEWFDQEVTKIGAGLNGISLQMIGYEIMTARYIGKSYTAAEDTMVGVSFSSDGTTMFLSSNANGAIYQYTLSTAWDVSTASYASKSLDTTGQDLYPYYTEFSPDGTVLFVLGVNSDTVYQYTLSTAWDVSTASYASKSFSVATQDTQPKSVRVSSDGTVMFVLGAGTEKVYRYTLSTAWDVSTASYSSQSLDVSFQASVSSAMTVNDDGTRVFVADSSARKLFEYELASAWSFSRTRYTDRSLALYAIVDYPSGLRFSADGQYLYISSTNATPGIHQYRTNVLAVAD